MKEYNNYKLLRIFINENERYEKHFLSDWILNQALENEIATASVFRGLEGFGGEKKIHTSKILALSIDLPLVVEIIDENDKIERFLSIIEPALNQAMVTIEDVKAKFYGPKK